MPEKCLVTRGARVVARRESAGRVDAPPVHSVVNACNFMPARSLPADVHVVQWAHIDEEKGENPSVGEGMITGEHKAHLAKIEALQKGCNLKSVYLT